MARERKYGWNGEMPAKAAAGQKAIVLRAMKDDGGMRTGHEWADIMAADIRTKQDPYRVVLYYIIILKGEGCVRTDEFDIHATTKNADVKHGVVVKVTGRVETKDAVEPEGPHALPGMAILAAAAALAAE